MYGNSLRGRCHSHLRELSTEKVVTQSTRFPGVKMENQVINGFYGYGYDRKVSNNMTFDLNLSQNLDFITKGLSIEVKGAYNTDYSYIKTVRGHVETYTPFINPK